MGVRAGIDLGQIESPLCRRMTEFDQPDQSAMPRNWIDDRRHSSFTIKRLQAGKRRAPRDQLERFRTLNQAVARRNWTDLDGFGNSHAPNLPYACGEMLRSTEDDLRKLQRAWSLIRQRGPR